MSNSKWKLLLLSICCLASTQTFGATTIACQGTISNLLVDSAGHVLITGTWRNAVTQICSVNGDLGTISATNCSIYYSLLETAYLNQEQITIYYDAVTYTCANLPTYASSPLPAYMIMQ